MAWDELRDHIERQTEENLARGMTPDEARRQARLALGNTALIEEDARAVWVSRWLEELRGDLRYALRTFRSGLGFAATAVVSLAVGIAAATGVFSVVNAALLNPFPFADSNRIVSLGMNENGKPRGMFVTARQLVALQGSDVFDGAFAFNTYDMTLAGGDFPETVRTRYLSATGLNVLGVPPLLGHGRRLISGNADGVLRVWDVGRGVVIATYGRAASIADVAFHGNMLAVASTDRRIHVWDTATGGKRQFVGHHDQVRSVSFTDDGRTLVSASEDETVKLWRLTDPQ